MTVNDASPLDPLKALSDGKCPRCGNYAAVQTTVRAMNDERGVLVGIIGYEYILTCFYCGTSSAAIYTEADKPGQVGILSSVSKESE